MSSCPDVEMLAAFVAGAASAEEVEAIATHLGKCAECRRVLDLVRRGSVAVPQPHSPGDRDEDNGTSS